MYNRSVLIDICGTLYDSNTTMDFLDWTFGSFRKYQLYRRVSRTFFARAVNKLLLQTFSFDFIRKIGISFLRGKSKEEISALVDEFYNSFLLQRQQKQPMEIVETYRAKGYKLILVSATLDCIARKVAEEMRISEWYTSTLRYEKGICTGTLTADLLHKKRNALRGNACLPPYGMTISDNLSDADLMRQSERSYIVCPARNKVRWERLLRKNPEINHKFIEI
ncbi:HAD family hydrolase [Parabacteroides sp.]